MKNKRIRIMEQKVQNILEYLIKRYQIKKPKKIEYKEDYDYIEIVLRDKESIIYSIEYDYINNLVIVQIQGKNYKDCYEMGSDYITLRKRIYQKTLDTILEKIYPNEFEYKVEKINGVTYYFEDKKEEKKLMINGFLWKELKYHLKNSYLNAFIELMIPMQNPCSEERMVETLLREDITISNVDDLISLLQESIGSLDIFVRIKNIKVTEDTKNVLDTYDGIIQKRRKKIEEEKIEVLPSILMDNEKMKILKL